MPTLPPSFSLLLLTTGAGLCTLSGWVSGAAGGLLAAGGFGLGVPAALSLLKRLRDSGKRIRTLEDSLHHLGEGVLLLDANYRIEYANPAALKLLASNEEDVVGQPAERFFHPGTSSTHDPDCPICTALRTGLPVNASSDEIIISSGEHLPVAVHATPIQRNGQTVGATIAFHDIIARLSAQSALARREEQLENLLEASPDPILFKDAQGRWQNANAAMLSLYGLEGKSYAGMTDLELSALTGPDQAAALRTSAEADQQVYAEGGLVRNTLTLPHPLQGPRTYDIYKIALRHPENARGLVVLSRDITEAEQARQATAETERRHRALIEATNESVLLLQPDGLRILGINSTAARRLNRSPEDLIGSSLIDILPPDLATSRKAAVDRVVETHRFTTFTDWRQGICFETRAYPILDNDQNVKELAVFARDVTEREVNRAFERLFADLDQALVELPSSLEELADVLCWRTVDRMQASIAWFGRREADGRVSVFAAAEQPGSHILAHLAHVGVRWDDSDLGKGPVGHAIRSGEPHTVSIEDASFSRWAEHAKAQSVHRISSVPILLKGQCFGALTLAGSANTLVDTEAFRERLPLLGERISTTLESAIDQQRTRLLETALSSAANAVFITDPEGLIEWANDSLCDLTGYPREVLIGQTPRIFRSGEHDQSIHEEMWRTILDGQVWRGEVIDSHKNGRPITVIQTITPLVEASGEISHFVSILEDITVRKAAEARIAHMARHDLLTDLPNRTLFFEQLQRSLALAKRNERTLALLFIDLDRFKAVNDTHGHASGDLLLQQAAHRLLDCTREGDFLARLAGDEFVLLLPDIQASNDAASVAEKIVDVMATSFDLDGIEAHIGASVGVALYPNDGEQADALLTAADEAMYKAKHAGRNRYCFRSIAAP